MTFVPQLHHEMAIHHLVTNQRAALFAGMGLGKTASTLAAFTQLHRAGKVRAMLVVAPLAVVNLVWPLEAHLWEEFQWMKVVALRTKESWVQLERGEADVYLINYESLPKLVQKYLARVKKPAFDLVVFDELTKAKNHSSQRINELRRYLKAPWRWGLTGTPTPNSLLELFAQIRLLDDGERFGRSFSAFRDCYFHATDYQRFNWEALPGTEEKLYSRISDIALTLLSSEFLDIPDTDLEDVELNLTSAETQVYRTMEHDFFASFPTGVEITAVNAAVLTNKLLQLASGAIYLDQGDQKQEGPKKWLHLHDHKLEALAGVRKREKGPLLVGCNYRHEVDRIRKAFPEAACFVDHPGVEAQQKLQDRWNRGEIQMLVADSRSVGHGLNLQHGGNTIVWFSLPWSGEVYDQFNARIRRTGQKKTPKTYRLLVKGTVDYLVVSALERKSFGQRALLEALTEYRKMIS